MLARRGKFNIKPNVAKGSQRSKPEPEKPKSPEPEDTPSPTSPVEANDGPSSPIATSPILTHDNMAEQAPAVLDRPKSPMSAMLRDPFIAVPAVPNDSAFAVPLSPVPKQNHQERALSPTLSECSTMSERTRNERRKFTGFEDLDTKSMRIMDMISWNPRKGQALVKKQVSDVSSVCSPSKESTPAPQRTLAPQVKIGPDGSLILDESSLLVSGQVNDNSIWETVDDDRIGRKVTSLSFRNRLWRKGTLWTEKETELFYEILRCTGPDFGLMHEYFPSRARRELKSKYNREERLHWAKINDILAMPRLLDDTLLDRVARLNQEIEEEASAKVMAKLASKRKGSSPVVRKYVISPATIDWDETKADLIAEAEEIILKLELQDSAKRKKLASMHDDSTSSSEEDEVEWNEEKQKKREPMSQEARKIIAEARQQVRASKRAAAQPPKKYTGFEEVEDDSDDDEEPIVIYNEDEPSSSKNGREIEAIEKKLNKTVLLSNNKAASQTQGNREEETVEGSSEKRGSSSQPAAEEAELVLQSPRPSQLSRLKKPPPFIKKSS